MKKEVTTDALVMFPDALKWTEPLMQENPDHVIRRVLAIEPAVFGVAANIGKRTCERLEAHGLSPPPSEADTASAPDAPTGDPSARPRAARQSRCQPTVRLASVSVMSEADQRRLELLLDALVERRVARHLQQGEP